MKRLIIITILMLVSLSSSAHKNSKLSDEQAISFQAKAFSQAFVEGDVDKLMEIYTPSAHIISGNRDIESDINNIRKFWTPKPNKKHKLMWHKTESKELIIEGDMASDIGYYSGLNRFDDGREKQFKGTYVIVWRKIEGVWRMHIDMWASIKE